MTDQRLHSQYWLPSCLTPPPEEECTGGAQPHQQHTRETEELKEWDYPELHPWMINRTAIDIDKPPVEKRKRQSYSTFQTLELEAEFHKRKFLTRELRKELANDLGLTELQVKTWFQNRRAKEKKLAKRLISSPAVTDMTKFIGGVLTSEDIEEYALE